MRYFVFFILLNIIGSTIILAENQDAKINHMVGVYLSKRGLSPIEHNLDQVFELNGFATTDYYLDKYIKRTGRTAFNDLVPDNDKLQKVARSIRYYFRKFFKGLWIRSTHDLEVEVDGLVVTAEWEKFGVRPSIDSDSDLLFTVEVVAKNFKVFVDKVTAKDHLHKFIGDVGMDGLYFELDPASDPLTISVPIKIFVQEDGSLKVKVQDTITNILDVDFKSGFRSPMRLPRVQIEINGRKAWLRLKEVERVLKSKMSTIVNGLKENIQKVVDDSAIPELGRVLNQYVGHPYTEVSSMDPVGIPNGSIGRRYLWGLSLQELGLLGENLHVGLKGFVKDPTLINVLPVEDEKMASGVPEKSSFDNVNYDLALSLNQGFINRLLQLGHNRDYFKKITLEGGDNLSLVESPYLIFNKDAGRLTIKTKYTVTGFQKIFIRNPMVIKMDILVHFKINDEGKLQMLVDKIDLDSISIKKKYIRVFRKTVRKKIRKILGKMNRGLKGYILSEELPIPSSIGGVTVKLHKTKLDNNGHLIIFLNYNL